MPFFLGIIDTLKKMRYRGIKPKFCPMCKGSNIYPKFNFGILPSTFSCKECGYEGSLVLELEPESNEDSTLGEVPEAERD